MADQSPTTDRPETAQSGQYGQPGQSGQPEGRPNPDHQDQGWYNASFHEQMQGVPTGSIPGTSGIDMTNSVMAAYFDSLEAQRRQFDEQVRATRRVTDLWAQSLILTQTTQQVARAVAPVVASQIISFLKSNPSLIKDLVHQSS